MESIPLSDQVPKVSQSILDLMCQPVFKELERVFIQEQAKQQVHDEMNEEIIKSLLEPLPDRLEPILPRIRHERGKVIEREKLAENIAPFKDELLKITEGDDSTVDPQLYLAILSCIKYSLISLENK